MLTLCRSTVLGAAFLAGVTIAASADPLCCTPTGPCRPPGPQIATLPLANVTLADVAPSHPITMPLSRQIYRFPGLAAVSFHGLPGLLADSLPDRFGNALIDAWLATQGRRPEDRRASGEAA